MFSLPIPEPIHIDVVGAKITGVKTHKVNIFEAWKDKGVILKQPLAKYTPPKNIDDIVHIGIATGLQKQEDVVKKELEKTKQTLEMQEIATKIHTLRPKPHPAYEAIKALQTTTPVVRVTPPTPPTVITAGGAQFDLGSVTGAVGSFGNWLWSGIQQAGEAAGKTIQDVGKVWNALVHLADLVNDMYNFLKDWKEISERINSQLITLSSTNKALTEFGNRMVLENRKFYAEISKMLNESLANYFDNLVFNLLKYGSVDVPTAIVGSVVISVKNKTPMPMTITIPNLEIKSGGYTLYKGAQVINALPFETDVGEIPFTVSGVEESKYLLDVKKNKGVIPLQITGDAITPVGKYRINISKEVKI